MLEDFKKFLLQSNALALAVGVVIGAAIGKVVSSLVADVIMPVISLAIPGGAWRDAKIVLTSNPDGTVKNAIAMGQFFGNIIDFVIIATAVFLITKALIKPEPPGSPMKNCAECTEAIPAAAKRCKYCTSPSREG
jgi:large conductance mechanosensitive channel